MRHLWQMVLVIFLVPVNQLHAGSDIIEVANAWINEAPPGIAVNAAYLTIKNTGSDGIVLEKVESPGYERIEMHRSVIDNDRVLMQRLDHIEIEAGNTLQFTPGDYHLMLIKPARSMRAGDMTSLRLSFSDGSQITVDAEVKKLKLEHQHHH